MKKAPKAMMAKTGRSRVAAGERREQAAPVLPSPSHLIDVRIRALGDWRGETLARVREIIRGAAPGVVEEWKWSGPVWSHAACGIICTGETYKNSVKMTFAKGAAFEDPSGLFNASLDGKTRRAIDLHRGDAVDEKALQALVREAVAVKGAGAGRSPKAAAAPARPARGTSASSARPMKKAAKKSSRGS